MILNKSLPQDFYAMFLTFIEIATIIIDIMGQNFFNDKFSIKSLFLKVKGQ